MIYTEKISGSYTYLRHVRCEDAEFILSLRTDPLNSRYINDTENDLDLQIEWIKQQQCKPDDYYFMICDSNNNRKGLISLYNFDHDERKAEMGRLICPKSPIQLYESLILICVFCFEILDFNRMFFRMDPDNVEMIAVTHNWDAEFVGYGNYPNNNKYIEFQSLQEKWPELNAKMKIRLEKFVKLINWHEKKKLTDVDLKTN